MNKTICENRFELTQGRYHSVLGSEIIGYKVLRLSRSGTNAGHLDTVREEYPGFVDLLLQSAKRKEGLVKPKTAYSDSDLVDVSRLNGKFSQYLFNAGWIATSTPEALRLARAAHLDIDQTNLVECEHPAIVAKERSHLLGLIPGKIVAVAFRHDNMPQHDYDSNSEGNSIAQFYCAFPSGVVQYTGPDGRKLESRFYVIGPKTESSGKSFQSILEKPGRVRDDELKRGLEKTLLDDFMRKFS